MSRLELDKAAELSRHAALQMVNDVMIAHQRFSTWEAGEVDIHIAIRSELAAFFQAAGPPYLRVAREYGGNMMKNVPGAHDDPHPVDLAVFYPLVLDGPGNGNAWADENCAVLGLIEVKKDWRLAVNDAVSLSKIARSPSGTPALQWALLVVYFNGSDADAVRRNARSVGDLVTGYGFVELSLCQPIEVPHHQSNAGVRDLWYDVICYGLTAGG